MDVILGHEGLRDDRLFYCVQNDSGFERNMK